MHRESVAQLRRVVVTFISDQRLRRRIKHSVITRITEEWPKLDNSCYNDKVTHLLNYLSVDGHWGGEETIVAVMEIFNVSIKVYFENDMVQNFMQSSNATTQALEIFYRFQTGSRSVYNHYDSVIAAELIAPIQVSARNRRLSTNQTVDATSSNDSWLIAPVMSPKTSGNRVPNMSICDKIEIIRPTETKPNTRGISTNNQVPMKPRLGTLRLCSYNVRGCNELGKRNQVDAILYDRYRLPARNQAYGWHFQVRSLLLGTMLRRK